jgi:hypothetical protein
VAAAKTAEPERACPAAGLNVGRFGADAERDGDLTDGSPLVFAFQQRAGLAPHVFAAAVELHGRKGIDRLAYSCGGDRVVALSGGDRAMPHQLSQHVHRRAGISMLLGIAVPVRVEEHRGLVELGAVRANQRFEVVDPAAVRGSEDVIRARPAAVPVRVARGIGARSAGGVSGKRRTCCFCSMIRAVVVSLIASRRPTRSFLKSV